MPDFDWPQLLELLTFAGTTGIITALLTNGLSAFGAWLKSEAAASHLALRVAALLEQFARECSSAAADVELYKSSGGHAGTAFMPIPDLPPLPEDLEAWRALKAPLRNRAISFPNTVGFQRAKVSFQADFDDDPDPRSHSGASLEANIRLALLALELAHDLRKGYNWDVPAEQYADREWMQREMADIDAEARARQERDAAVFASMEEGRKRAEAIKSMVGPDGLIGPEEPTINRLMRETFSHKDGS